MDSMQKKKHLFAIRKMAQAHFSWYYHSQAQNCFKEWIMYCYPQCKTSMYHYKGIPQKIKPFFFLSFLKSVFSPQGFCEIWERWNSGPKRRFSWWSWFFLSRLGNQPPHPHIFGKFSPQKTLSTMKSINVSL